ncbi:hypothetical protein [Cryptosporangium phraense]|uniref:hypothetical protein n=1 Tax=Cryptosporangium phraense TaxID=2593070 RepID=UPI001478C0B0|nr:hypothetical protein [Cryptosporangium phraense]
MDDVARLRQMADEVRAIRTRTCEPKSNENKRYLDLSVAVSGLNKAADDIENEGLQTKK